MLTVQDKGKLKCLIVIWKTAISRKENILVLRKNDEGIVECCLLLTVLSKICILLI